MSKAVKVGLILLCLGFGVVVIILWTRRRKYRLSSGYRMSKYNR